jgi:hypothetical protein
MKWLILGAALVATVLGIWILLGEQRPGARRSSMRAILAAVAALAVMGGIAYAAHVAGFFALPIVVVLFVPFGLTGRWAMLATRDIRKRHEAAAPSPPPTARERIIAVAFWPVFVVLVLAVAGLGFLAAMLAAQQ